MEQLIDFVKKVSFIGEWEMKFSARCVDPHFKSLCGVIIINPQPSALSPQPSTPTQPQTPPNIVR